MQEVIDEDEIAARNRVQLPHNSRYIFEESPLLASSPPPIRRRPTVESVYDERDSDSEGEFRLSGTRYILEPAIHAPAGHRSPTAFNAFQDWRVSDTDWGKPGMHSYTRDGELKVTGHRTVKRVEYLFDLPPYIPIPDDAHDTAFVIDLDSTEFDLRDKHGKLYSIDGLIKKHDNDSWKGTTGSADTFVSVTFGEGQKPILCRRSRLTCKGGFACSFVGSEFVNVERRFFDAELRAVTAIWSKKCTAIDTHGNVCTGVPIVKENRLLVSTTPPHVKSVKYYQHTTPLGTLPAPSTPLFCTASERPARTLPLASNPMRTPQAMSTHPVPIGGMLLSQRPPMLYRVPAPSPISLATFLPISDDESRGRHLPRCTRHPVGPRFGGDLN
ncbi:hypothetical protein C8F01DRAFT_1242012 [Mycena amicta]|nr:hypothetical protein C8F01DRAFT_1242012 [Mycena amicta]